MASQFTNPLLVLQGAGAPAAHGLTRVALDGGGAGVFSEGWLQRLFFAHPELLPVEELEPVFGPLTPICRELPTPAGPVDLLFLNAEGLPTLVECKLWRNPEARREVVGQLLDYAKELARWSYEDLEHAVRRAVAEPGPGLVERMRAATGAMDEPAFIDAVSRNLRRGRFLLLIVGDGIREGVERMAEYLQRHAHLNFTLALVEMAVFQLPAAVGEGLVVQPRVVARTVELERAVVRIDGDRIVAAPPVAEMATAESRNGPKRTRISEQVFFERLAASPETVAALRDFLSQAEALGLTVEPGDNTLNLKSADGLFNFGNFNADGTFRNIAMASRARKLGVAEVADRYYDALAALVPGATVDRRNPNDPFRWTVRRGDRLLTLEELMPVRAGWLALLEQTLGALSQAVG